MVSASYVGYGNGQFLEEIGRLLDKLAAGDEFTFHEAFCVTTELTIRYTSEKRLGRFKNRQGEADDKTLLGLEFKNSMVNTSSVRLSYFLHRLICSNGMMVPTAAAASRVFHSGDPGSFRRRLGDCFGEVHRKLDSMDQMLHDLADIEFNPSGLAMDGKVVDAVFDIIFGSKLDLCVKHKQFLGLPKNGSETEKRRLKQKHDVDLLGYIPDQYGGNHAKALFQSLFRSNASLFDCLNVFTEYAKTRSPTQRLDIQAKTGALAKYIADNTRKFLEKEE